MKVGSLEKVVEGTLDTGVVLVATVTIGLEIVTGFDVLLELVDGAGEGPKVTGEVLDVAVFEELIDTGEATTGAKELELLEELDDKEELVETGLEEVVGSGTGEELAGLEELVASGIGVDEDDAGAGTGAGGVTTTPLGGAIAINFPLPVV